jgi:STE24 endopeptidase
MRFCALLLFIFGLSLSSAATPTEAKAIRAADQDKSAYTLPPDKLEKAIENDQSGLVLALIQQVGAILVLGLILVLGIAARLRDWAVRSSASRWIQCFVFVGLFGLLLGIANFPLVLYDRYLDLKYAMTVESWGGFFADLGKNLLITFVLASLGTMLLFWVIRKSPRRWWFWFWVPYIAITTFVTFIQPYILDPLFNKFQPLTETNPALVEQLEKVVARGQMDIPPSRMFLMKASDKVTTVNAYVTGLGASKRIVVWDTSIQKGTTDEILFIFGHEMGHYVLGHRVWGLVLGCVFSLILFWAGYRGVDWLLRWKGPAWRIPSQHDWAALVVLVLVFEVVSFLFQPVEASFARMKEHDADVYGQEAVHGIVADPQKTGRDTFQLLGEASLRAPNPNPLVEFWFYNHPSTSRRAAFALHYDPWAPGENPKYFAK